MNELFRIRRDGAGSNIAQHSPQSFSGLSAHNAEQEFKLLASSLSSGTFFVDNNMCRHVYFHFK